MPRALPSAPCPQTAPDLPKIALRTLDCKGPELRRKARSFVPIEFPALITYVESNANILREDLSSRLK